MKACLPLGKFKFQPLSEIPTEYLEWVLNVLDARNPMLIKGVADELRMRARTSSTSDRHVDTAMAQQIITSGRRTLAQRFHPDKGGDPAIMKQVNHTADVLLENIRTLVA